MSLFVSHDGYLDRLELDNAQQGADGIVRVPARIKVLEAQWGDFAKGGIEAHKDKLQFSTASGKARWALDVERIDPGGLEIRQNGDGKVAVIPGVVRFWQGQDRLGDSMENPLPGLIARWMKESRISCGRLFAVTETGSNFTGADVREAHDAQWVKYHPESQVLDDGRILLPFSHVNFPVRFDANVLRKDALKEAIMVGRATIETIQPGVKLSLGDIPPHAYRIGATQFSILSGLRAVIDPVVVDRGSRKPTAVRHGTSVVWDGGRTTGFAPQHLRHLEVENTSDSSLYIADLAVAVRMYHAENFEQLPKTLHSLPSAHIHERGIQVDTYFANPENATGVRTALEKLDKNEDIFGLVVGPKGMRPVYNELSHEFQDLAVIAASEAAMRQEFTPMSGWEELGELQKVLAHVSDYRQRAMLLTRTAPSADVLSTLMKLGLRGVCTPNVAGDVDQIYLNEALLQQYSTLMKKGFGLYLITPEKIRKLWHQLFVDVTALERVSKADFRIGGYAASAAGAESVMKLGHLEEALAMVKADYPNAAMVTGASESGGMGYLNRAAVEAGLVTIGVANKIPGQEKANDSYDAVMYHGRDDFVTRQGHISRMVSMPWVSIGAEGSNFEQALHLADLKIGLGAFAPMSYIDPVGLDKDGQHMWRDAIIKLQQTFTATHYKTDDAFTLSRSPYVGSMLHFTDSYADAYKRSQSFCADPVKYLRGKGVPDRMINLALESMMKDAEFTGLPVHAFWQQEIDRRKRT